jgi:hypothetical protein
VRNHPPPSPPTTNPRLRWLPYLFGAGAVFWLIEMTQFAAWLAAPVARDQFQQMLIKGGITHDFVTILAVYAAFFLLILGTLVATHATAFYGLRRMRAWGWVAAVIVAGGYSLIILGIPLLVFLLQRPTRQAYGIS